MNLSTNQKIYLKYIGASLAFLWGVGIVQIGYVYGRFEFYMLIIPGFVGATLGYLLAKQRILKDANSESKRRFRSVVEMADEMATLQSLDGSFIFVSQAAKTLTGYSPEDFYSSPTLWVDLIVPEDRDSWMRYHSEIHHMTPEASSSESKGVVVRIRHQAGHLVWLRYRAKAIFENGEKVNISSVSIDVTESVAHEAKLKELAETDQLTQLPNRIALKKQSESLLRKNQPFALVMLDLNRFKSVNDSLGHSVGDTLLNLVAKRLLVGMDESVSIYRFGGDEFVLIISDIEHLQSQLEQLRQIVNAQYNINHLELSVSGSFGYVCYPEDATDFETLVRFSDAAMYQSKHTGANYTRYTGSAAEIHEKSMYIERYLDSAIQEKKIRPYFQPIYADEGKKLVAVECLARWHTEELGWIAPDDFIAIAESIGSIQLLGDSILRQSLDVYQEINAMLKEPISFSINVSVLQLLDDRFVDDVLALLSRYDVVPGTIKLEVTESIFLGQKEMALKSLERLRQNGIQISLDDFGTGYSALSVLKDFSIDQLKLDRSFMDDIHENKKAQSLVKYAIQMAHDMGIEVVAEGIEHGTQLAYLKNLDCNLYQGYLLSRPMARESLLKLCQNSA